MIKAIETYKASLEIDPGYYKALYNLGNTYHKIDQPEKAIQYWLEAIKSKPDFDHAYFN
jgi:tetratricopeptide (TPR) repeat protein